MVVPLSDAKKRDIRISMHPASFKWLHNIREVKKQPQPGRPQLKIVNKSKANSTFF